MNKDIENIIKKWLKKHKDDGQWVSDYDGEFDLDSCCLDGDFDLNDLVDEVLRVVVETGEKLSQCISEIRKIDNQRMIEASKNNRVYDASVTFWCQVMEKILLDYNLSPNKENKIIHKSCGTKSSKGEYEDGTVDYLCHNCDCTFLDDNEQTIIS